MFQAHRLAIEQRPGEAPIRRRLDPLVGATGERGEKPRFDRRAAVPGERDENFDFLVIDEDANELGVEVVAPRDGAGARVVACGGGEESLARRDGGELQNVERGFAAAEFEARKDVGGLGAGREFARDRTARRVVGVPDGLGQRQR